MMELIGNDYFVGKRFKLKKKIGTGSHGDVYLSDDTVTGEEVAAKIGRSSYSDALVCEHTLYQKMLRAPGVPKLHWFEKNGSGNFLVMELVGPSLEDLFIECGNQFSMKTVLMLAGQMIDRVEYLHSLHYIHRDLKPDNFAMGIGRRSSQVYLLDFGVADKYYEPIYRKHIRPAKVAHLHSTPRYASINAMNCFQSSRRDDLESLGYCFMYFILGDLPWQGLNEENTRQKYERIAEMKNLLVLEMIKAFPPQFGAYMNYVRCLSFDQQPDYEYLRNLFKDLLAQRNYEHDFLFDWDLRRLQQNCHRLPV